MSEITDNGEPTAVQVGANPYNTYGLATQGFVWAAISSVSGDFTGRVNSVNGCLPDSGGNVEISSLASKDYSGEINELRVNLTALSAGVEYRLLTNVDYDSLHQYTDDKTDELRNHLTTVDVPYGEDRTLSFYTTSIESPVAGDVMVLRKAITESGEFSYSSFIYDGSEWKPADGRYCAGGSEPADAVFFTDNITTAYHVSDDISDGSGNHAVSAKGMSLPEFVSKTVLAEIDSRLPKVFPQGTTSLVIFHSDDSESRIEISDSVRGAVFSVVSPSSGGNVVEIGTAEGDSVYIPKGNLHIDGDGTLNDALTGIGESLAAQADVANGLSVAVAENAENIASNSRLIVDLMSNGATMVGGGGSDMPFIALDPTLTISGDAADAKAVGDALRTRPTSSDIERGWWSPWRFWWSSGSGMQEATDRLSSCEYDASSGAWVVTFDYYGSTETHIAPGGPDDREIAVDGYTGLRIRVTPTKTSQIVNDGAPKGNGIPFATVADAEPTPVYSWNVVPPTAADGSELSLKWDISEGRWKLYKGDVSVASAPSHLSFLTAVSITFDGTSSITGGGPVTAYRTQTVVGYVFGSHYDKVVAPTDGAFVFDGSVSQGLIFGEPKAVGNRSSAFGNSKATGDYSHAEGADNMMGGMPGNGEALEYPVASGYASHAEGAAHAVGDYSHAEGGGNDVKENNDGVLMTVPVALGKYSHAEGTHTYARGAHSHAEGSLTVAAGNGSHAEGGSTRTGARYAHAEGVKSVANASGAHAEGGYYDEANATPYVGGTASGCGSHAEGIGTTASGYASHAEGELSRATGNYSHAEGEDSLAASDYSHAEGYKSEANESSAHAEGYKSVANAPCSHAEGGNGGANVKGGTASGIGSHAEGAATVANANYSHAEGAATTTTAGNDGEHAEGKWNYSHEGTIHSIGIGSNNNNRKNAVEVMSNGNVYVIGVGGYEGNNLTGSESLSAVVRCRQVSVTWFELKTLRDGGKLVPGMDYRITDYTVSTNGDMSSAAHICYFDLIVTADSSNTLNESARAARHAGDSYFPNTTKFEAWKVWYCLDNDTSRFAWSPGTGKGVIYRLVDEFDNDCPYDFKSITFAPYYNGGRYCLTFDSSGDTVSDQSLSGAQTGVCGNRIGRYVSGGKQHLNCVVFKGEGNGNNVMGDDCRNLTFMTGCAGNVVGNDCQNIRFNISCNSNVLAAGCSSDMFGPGCCRNRLGCSCHDIAFGSYYNDVSLGDSCHNIIFKRDDVVKDFVSYVTIENGNCGIVLNMTGSSSANAPYRNVTVRSGVNNGDSVKTITDPTDGGQTFHTTFKPTGSVEVSI